MSKNVKWLLGIILVIGILIRFINFSQSIYFGYDEARDAFVSQEIYLKGKLKLTGPSVSAFEVIHHGPFFYYLLGPLFLLSGGDPYLPSIFFRLINSAGIIGIFSIGWLFFNPFVGLISAYLFAVSYEEYIYSLYAGNPSSVIFCWIIAFIGAGIVYKYPKKKILGATLMIFGGSLAGQFDIVSSFLLIVMLVIFFLLRKRLTNIPIKRWLLILTLGLSPLITYLLAEIKFNFIATKTILHLFSSKINVAPKDQNLFDVFLTNFLGLFRNNIIDFSLNNNIISIFFLLVIFYLLFKARSDLKYLIFVVWILSMTILMINGGFMPLYSYAGVGIGLIISFSVLLYSIFKKNFLVAILLLALVTFSNLGHIINQSKKSLVVEIKAQTGMKLSDEKLLVQYTYDYAKGDSFTIRTTSMPYQIQTVWAYLYNQFGLKKYGYLPYFENRNVLGYPGYLPEPIKGSTCLRYLIREPIRGIPEHLISQDQRVENYFSEIILEKHFGEFILQVRKSRDQDCHNNKP